MLDPLLPLDPLDPLDPLEPLNGCCANMWVMVSSDARSFVPQSSGTPASRNASHSSAASGDRRHGDALRNADTVNRGSFSSKALIVCLADARSPDRAWAMASTRNVDRCA